MIERPLHQEDRHALEADGVIEGLVDAERPPFIFRVRQYIPGADGIPVMETVARFCFVPPRGSSKQSTRTMIHEGNLHRAEFWDRDRRSLGFAEKHEVTAEQALRISQKVKGLTGVDLTDWIEIG